MAQIRKVKMALDGNGEPIPVLQCGINGQTVAIGAASVQSVAFDNTDPKFPTKIIRIVGTGPFHYLVGNNPTALATSPFLPANVVEFLLVDPGDRIAIIQDAASTGNVYISEVA